MFGCYLFVLVLCYLLAYWIGLQLTCGSCLSYLSFQTTVIFCKWDLVMFVQEWSTIIMHQMQAYTIYLFSIYRVAMTLWCAYFHGTNRGVCNRQTKVFLETLRSVSFVSLSSAMYYLSYGIPILMLDCNTDRVRESTLSINT